MAHEHQIHAWAAMAAKGKCEKWQYVRKCEDDDVFVKIDVCSICMSDIHTQDANWGHTEYPFVGGHEIVGKVAEVGKNVKSVKVGDRVGVGPLSGACGQCEYCKKDYEQLCPKRVFTYNGKDLHGRLTYGGYADGIVVQEKFAIKLPEGLETVNAAPLLCAGVTVWSPLKRHTSAGQKVAILAIGGLGHLAVMFAAKMGHHVTAVSRGTNKKDLCTSLGANEYVDSTNAEAMKKIESSFDFVLDCASFDGNLTSRLQLVKPQGTLCIVGVPDEPFSLAAFELIGFERKLVGSLVGSPKDTQEMFDFCVKHDLKVMVSEVAPMSQVNRCHEEVKKGTPRFRIVLKNDF